MTLALVTGRPGHRFDEIVTDALRREKESGFRPIWVVPDNAMAARVLPRIQQDMVVGASAQSYNSLLSALWEGWGSGEHIVDAVARDALLQECIGKHRWSDPSLQHVSHSRGFRTLLGRLCEMRDAEGALTAGSPIEREIEAILLEYRTRLEEVGAIERSTAIKYFTKTAPEELGRDKKTYHFTGFNFLSGTQLSLITTLARSCPVTVYLEWERDIPVTEHARASVLYLEEKADSTTVLPSLPASHELEQAVCGLWDRDKTGSLEPKGHTRLLEAVGDGLEPYAIALEVKRLIEEGYAEEEIAIAHPDLVRCFAALQEALAREGSSSVVDMALPLEATQLGTAFLALMSVARGSGGRPEMLRFLQSSFSGISLLRASKLDARWRRRRIRSSQAMLSSAASEDPQLRRFVDGARAVVSLPAGVKWARRCEELVSELFAVGVATGDLDAQEIVLAAASQAAIVDVLGQTADLKDTLGTEAFWAALSEAKVVTGDREKRGSVLLTEYARLHGRSFAAVILAGLSESEMKAGGDEDIASRFARQMGLADPLSPTLRQRALFSAAVQSAQERLVLSRTTKDLRGEDIAPASLLEDLLSVFKTSSEGRASGIPRYTTDYSDLSAVMGPVAPRIHNDARQKSGYLLSHAQQNELAHKEIFSITELEAYLECPYKWFFSRVISPQGIDTEVDGRIRGSVAHKALETVYRSVLEELPQKRILPKDLPWAYAKVSEALEGARETYLEGDLSASEQATFDGLQRALCRLLAADASFPTHIRPAALEWSFGEEEPVEIEGLALRGRIDRIDRVGDDGAIVFDYKLTNRKVSGIKSFESKNCIQAVLYALVVEKHFHKPVAGTYYRSIMTGEIRGYENAELLPQALATTSSDRVSDTLRDELYARAVAQAHRAAEGIREARIEPAPGKDACEFCPASLFCKEWR